MDGRTREAFEAEVLKQVRDYHGFSIFWITANRQLAAAGTRLVDSGTIEVTPKGYPWSDAKIIHPNEKSEPS